MTIEHLGFKMYSHLPNAVAELVANSYDADATSVQIILDVTGDSLIVADDGHGMSLDELQTNYLTIGRNRRAQDRGDLSESGRRRVAGRKGLGKLAVFGIGNTIVVETKRAGSAEYAEVTMVWDDILGAAGSEYKPTVRMRPADVASHFTRIRLSDLTRKTAVKARVLAASLSRLFNYPDADFNLSVLQGDERVPVNRELRYDSIEQHAHWSVPDEFSNPPELVGGVSGTIIAATKPLPAPMRGVTLYVRGRMANEPEYFGVPESSHAFSYITGFVEADALDSGADVIATDRRSVNWDMEQAAALRDYLADVIRSAAQKRRVLRARENKDRASQSAGIDVDAWKSTIRGEKQAAAVESLLDEVVSPENDIDDARRQKLVEGIKAIAPEHADFHWRTLHPSIQRAAEREYRDGQYHHAVVEAIKAYVRDVRRIGAKPDGMSELDVLRSTLNGDAPAIDIIVPFSSVGLSPDTQKNMRGGQRLISEALWTGFRNPIQHEGVRELEEAGVFTYQDCLDALSILSHLRRRIELVESAAGVD
ncbi:TIGR02391 family protein [Microbacterium dauci]|uniref:TIGR02391 family protein n=1 Tax=Microbacterium dauci TaxID=3048008 RepID=A0ABT6ZCK4_9MICO|nr:TIGR02391 family protein [Microbacterium sp. LX3-4]MDJ1113387.1 TIGR02391 family protein [Microbacterium sp. LX3-4]